MSKIGEEQELREKAFVTCLRIQNWSSSNPKLFKRPQIELRRYQSRPRRFKTMRLHISERGERPLRDAIGAIKWCPTKKMRCISRLVKCQKVSLKLGLWPQKVIKTSLIFLKNQRIRPETKLLTRLNQILPNVQSPKTYRIALIATVTLAKGLLTPISQSVSTSLIGRVSRVWPLGVPTRWNFNHQRAPRYSKESFPSLIGKRYSQGSSAQFVSESSRRKLQKLISKLAKKGC